MKNEKLYTIEDMKRCFEESRLTHPMVGFKHEDFNQFLVQAGDVASPPEYQILSFKIKDGVICDTLELGADGQFHPSHEQIAGTFSLQALLKFENTSIHSVKRLSDGEVFTVGDMVYAWGGKQLRKIHGLYITDASHLTVKLDSDTGTTAMLMSLRKPEPEKQPLFTTEDGVGIKAGEFFYTVKPEGNYLIVECRAIASDYSDLEKEYKYFSTREKAEEFCIENRPVFSLAEVLKTDSLLWKQSEEFRKLAKERASK